MKIIPWAVTAASVLALMGATAQAAQVGNTMDYAQAMIVTLGGPSVDGSGAGTGTGIFESSGELIVASSLTFDVPAIGSPGTVVTSTIYQGSISGSTWTFSGTLQPTYVSCTGNLTLCAFTPLGTIAPISGYPTFTLDIFAGGTWFSSSDISVAILDSNHTLTPVPLPAAAWLFGSALLGLAAVKRRKA